MKIAAAYIPVVHKGHQEFCRKVKPDVLYVLGKSFQSDFPLLERDIRALGPKEIVKICKILKLAGEVKVLEKQNLSDLKKATTIVFVDDEVMRGIAAQANIPVSFEKVFLRWNKMAAITAHPVNPDIVISKSDFDRELMKKARIQSEKSSDWWRRVGALIVKDGEIVLKGFNQHKPTEHSLYIDGDPRGNFDAGDAHLKDMNMALHGEAGLIAQAARQGISLEGTSLYVTTFPCPTCALSIIQSGIKSIYYAEGYSNLNAEHNFRSAGIQLIRVES